jgi:hypothetical protein
MSSSEYLARGCIPRPSVELTQLYTLYNITTRRRIHHLVGQVLIIDNKQLRSYTTLVALRALSRRYRIVESCHLLLDLLYPPHLLLTSGDLHPQIPPFFIFLFHYNTISAYSPTSSHLLYLHSLYTISLTPLPNPSLSPLRSQHGFSR